MVERVEQVVVLDDGLRLFHVGVDERIQRLAHLRLAELRQPRQIVHRAQGRRLVQVDGALGDVHGQVADALEVDDDLEGGGDEAQVAGGGLAQREDAAAALVHLQLEQVDLAIGTDHFLGELGVALGERAHALRDLGFDLPAQGEQLGAQLFQLGIV